MTRHQPGARASLTAAALLIAIVGLPPTAVLASAQPAPASPKKAAGAASLLPGASSRDPVNIEAGKLDYFDKEQKLVYTGDVVAKQGESTLKASVLTIFLSRDAKGGTTPAAPAAPTADVGQAGNSVRRMEAAGPVTMLTKDEVGTGDNGAYDKAENKITLTGHVTLSQGTNMIKGDKLVYDMESGQAQVSGGQTQGRVSSVFTPGSSAPGGVASGEGSRKTKRGGALAAPGKSAPLPLATQ